MRSGAMNFNWRIFAIAFVFSLASGVLSNSLQLLYLWLRFTPETASWIGFGLGIASFVISPVLLFAVFYLIGENIDFVTQFQLVVVPLFVGSWIGHLAGDFSMQLIPVVSFGNVLLGPSGLLLVWYGFRLAFSLEFFVGFAAFSMAYIARKRSP